MHNQVFVSYSRRDENFVRQILIPALKDEFKLWFDREQLRVGEDWKQAIDEALQLSFAVIVVLSPEACVSPYVTYEWSYGLGLGLSAIPLICREVDNDRIHPRLGQYQWLDYTRSFNDIWPALHTRLKEKQALFQSAGANEVTLRLMEHAEQQYALNDLANALDSLEKAGMFAGMKLLDDIHYKMGIILAELKREDDAEKELLEALKHNKKHVRAMEALGTLYRQRADRVRDTDLEDYETLLVKAQVQFREALDIQPDLLDYSDGESVHGSLGGIYRRLGQIDNAVEAYTKATRVKRSSYPYNNLGLLYMEKGETDLMRKNFRMVELYAQSSILRDPGDVWAHNDLMMAQIVGDDLDEARETLSTMEIISPPYAIESLLGTLDKLKQLEDIPDASKAFVDEAITTLNGYLAAYQE